MMFMPSADAENVNAQSLNVREIVLRLNPALFQITLFYWHKPDPRLLNKPHIKLLPLPARFKTVWLMRQMLRGHEIIAYIDYSPASYLFVHLPKAMRRRTQTILHAEGAARLESGGRRERSGVRRQNKASTRRAAPCGPPTGRGRDCRLAT